MPGWHPPPLFAKEITGSAGGALGGFSAGDGEREAPAEAQKRGKPPPGWEKLATLEPESMRWAE